MHAISLPLGERNLAGPTLLTDIPGSDTGRVGAYFDRDLPRLAAGRQGVDAAVKSEAERAVVRAAEEAYRVAIELGQRRGGAVGGPAAHVEDAGLVPQVDDRSIRFEPGVALFHRVFGQAGEAAAGRLVGPQITGYR